MRGRVGIEFNLILIKDLKCLTFWLFLLLIRIVSNKYTARFNTMRSINVFLPFSFLWFSSLRVHLLNIITFIHLLLTLNSTIRTWYTQLVQGVPENMRHTYFFNSYMRSYKLKLKLNKLKDSNKFNKHQLFFNILLQLKNF